MLFRPWVIKRKPRPVRSKALLFRAGLVGFAIVLYTGAKCITGFVALVDASTHRTLKATSVAHAVLNLISGTIIFVQGVARSTFHHKLISLG